LESGRGAVWLSGQGECPGGASRPPHRAARRMVPVWFWCTVRLSWTPTAPQAPGALRAPLKKSVEKVVTTWPRAVD